MKRAISVCAVILLCITSDGYPTTYPDSFRWVVLPVPYVQQQTEVWCWAASAEMVFRSHGRRISQCETLSAWFFPANCCAQIRSCATTVPDTRYIQKTLFALGGIRSTWRIGALDFAEIMSEINARRPIIVGYRGSFSGHVVVLHGYDNRRNVYIHDPIYGSGWRVPYGSAFFYQGHLVWAETLYKISP